MSHHSKVKPNSIHFLTECSFSINHNLLIENENSKKSKKKVALYTIKTSVFEHCKGPAKSKDYYS